MTDDLFTTLAWKVLAGNASEDEKKTLAAAMEKQPDLASEFKTLQETFVILQTSSCLNKALESKEPALPLYRREELRQAVRKAFTPVDVPEKTAWWKLDWLPGGSYTTSALAVLLIALTLLNQRSGIEFGTYADSPMRDGITPGEIQTVSVQAFHTDHVFQQWKESRFGPEFRIWFDEARDLIIVTKSGGLFSSNTTFTLPLPESHEEREKALRDILTNPGAQKQISPQTGPEN